ncbi:hypothetical protein [Kurthia huakuii]|uniref:hypothetical protein n=1 Tax=Kurthia huakuii TaxID=1421019 RepID=UPI000495777A|nr:hypothetical protein [Kurthia huakuii]MBM7700591.1 hypothetical protein [Kurthia huakuii]
MKRIIRHATFDDADQIAAIHTVCKAALTRPMTNPNIQRANTVTSSSTPIRFEYDIALWKIYLHDPSYKVMVLQDRIVIGFIVAHQPPHTDTWLVAESVILQEYAKPHDREMLYASLMKEIYPAVNHPLQLVESL